jgi:hypothetical protein
MALWSQSLQAPTALLWHAVLDAKRLGMNRLLEVFYNLDVVLSPIAYRLQERILSPLWDRVHPLYFRLIRLRKGLS